MTALTIFVITLGIAICIGFAWLARKKNVGQGETKVNRFLQLTKGARWLLVGFCAGVILSWIVVGMSQGPHRQSEAVSRIASAPYLFEWELPPSEPGTPNGQRKATLGAAVLRWDNKVLNFMIWPEDYPSQGYDVFIGLRKDDHWEGHWGRFATDGDTATSARLEATWILRRVADGVLAGEMITARHEKTGAKQRALITLRQQFR